MLDSHRPLTRVGHLVAARGFKCSSLRLYLEKYGRGVTLFTFFSVVLTMLSCLHKCKLYANFVRGKVEGVKRKGRSRKSWKSV